MFESGFCWVTINNNSCIAKILSKEDDSHYTIGIGEYVFTNVPLSEMAVVNGDTDSFCIK